MHLTLACARMGLFLSTEAKHTPVSEHRSTKNKFILAEILDMCTRPSVQGENYARKIQQI